MRYDYARVSTDDQNPAMQLAALKKAKTVFRDEITGAILKRPALARCLKILQPGEPQRRVARSYNVSQATISRLTV